MNRITVTIALAAVATIATASQASAETTALCSCSVTTRARTCIKPASKFSAYCKGSSPLASKHKTLKLSRYAASSPGRCRTFCREVAERHERAVGARQCYGGRKQVVSKRRASFRGKPVYTLRSDRGGYRYATSPCGRGAARPIPASPRAGYEACEVTAHAKVRGVRRHARNRSWNVASLASCRAKVRSYLTKLNPCKVVRRSKRSGALVSGQYTFEGRSRRFSSGCRRMHGYRLR